MELIKRFRWPIIGVVVTVLVVGFLLFRPDKLFIDDTVDESLADAFPLSETTVAPTTTTPADPDTVGGASSSSVPASTTTLPEPLVPTAIRTGDLYGIDHGAEGTATVYEQDGRFVLRFEDDTDVQNGPDLFVWVLDTAGYEGGTPDSFIDLGKLKGNVGGQNYELPEDYDPDVDQSVLIWCKRFNTPFAAAPLA